MSRLVLLAALALGCADNGPGPAGDPCLTSAECEGGTVCYQTAIRGRECMTTCDPTETRLCESGAVCLAGPSVSVCYTGGERGLGELCDSSDVCEPGAVCVREPAATSAFCRRACDLRTAGGCTLEQICAPVGGTPAGYCVDQATE